MLKVYQNPESRRILIAFWSAVSLIFLLCLLGLIAIRNHYDALLSLQAKQMLATYQTQGDLISYLQTGQLSPQAQEQVQVLNQLQLVPKYWITDLGQLLLWGSLIYWGLALLLFGVITLTLNQVYSRIKGLHRFASEFFSTDSPLDIRSNTNGALSSLENELYHTAKELNTRLYHKKEQNEYLSKNIADISHQLKTPLTALFVVTDTLYALPPENRSDEQLALLEPQLSRIDSLVQALLLLTRLDASAIVFKKEHVPARAFLQGIVDELAILAIEKNLTIDLAVEEGLSFYADAFYLREAIANVLKNGIEHSPQDGHMRLQMDSNIFFTSLTISNNGAPIAKEDLPYIFQRFYRGKDAKDTSVGIGLALSYEIIDQQGGKLSAQNTDQGVSFIFTLPVESRTKS